MKRYFGSHPAQRAPDARY